MHCFRKSDVKLPQIRRSDSRRCRPLHKTVKDKDSYDVIRYLKCCSFQRNKSPTRITKNKSSLLDHVLTNSIERILQSGVIDIGVSNHQLIYCTRKVLHPKSNGHKQINIRSLKNNTTDAFHQHFANVSIRNYNIFTDVKLHGNTNVSIYNFVVIILFSLFV